MLDPKSPPSTGPPLDLLESLSLSDPDFGPGDFENTPRSFSPVEGEDLEATVVSSESLYNPEFLSDCSDDSSGSTAESEVSTVSVAMRGEVKVKMPV